MDVSGQGVEEKASGAGAGPGEVGGVPEANEGRYAREGGRRGTKKERKE